MPSSVFHQERRQCKKRRSRSEGTAVNESYASLGNLYFRRGHLDKAAEMYRQAIARIDPDPRHGTFPELYASLGNVYQAQGRSDDAEKMFRQALEKFPDDPKALNSLARFLVDHGRKLDEAFALA